MFVCLFSQKNSPKTSQARRKCQHGFLAPIRPKDLSLLQRDVACEGCGTCWGNAMGVLRQGDLHSGRKKPKWEQKHPLFPVLLFPSQSAGNFSVCRFKGDWRSWWQRVIEHRNPTFSSGSPWAVRGWGWGRPWGLHPTSLPRHLCLAVLGSRWAGPFFWPSSATLMLTTASAGWEAGMRVGGVHHQIQKNSYSPSFATSSSKTDPCA